MHHMHAFFVTLILCCPQYTHPQHVPPSTAVYNQVLMRRLLVVHLVRFVESSVGLYVLLNGLAAEISII